MIFIVYMFLGLQLACLHVHFWEPVPGSRTKNWFPKVPQQKCQKVSQKFLCVTQQNSGTRTKNWFAKVHM